MNKLTLLLVTTSSLTLTSCLSSGGGSSSSASSSSSSMFWNLNSFPLTIYASSDFNLAERELLNDMAVEWEDLGTQGDTTEDYDFFNLAIGGAITAVADPGHANVSSYRDNTLGIYILNNWPDDFSTSALAVTQLWGIRGNSGISISHFDIFFNQDLYSFYTDPADAGLDNNAYDMGTIALHELGHALGISHISNVPSNNAVMYPYLGSTTVKRTIRDCDLRALADNYSWSTDSTLCPQSLEAGDDLALNPTQNHFSAEQLDAAGINVGDEVGIVMELRNDGSCHHIVNGHDVYSHKISFKVQHEHNQEDLAHAH